MSMINRARLSIAGDRACSRCFVVFTATDSTLRTKVRTDYNSWYSYVYPSRLLCSITYYSLSFDSFDVELVVYIKFALRFTYGVVVADIQSRKQTKRPMSYGSRRYSTSEVKANTPIPAFHQSAGCGSSLVT